jgi:release factor glutamine methyltransferase
MLDIVVSNPPYIGEGELAGLQPELKYEPRIALAAGEDGLKYYRVLAREAQQLLKAGGFLALEINEHKASEISSIVEQAGFSLEKLMKDYAGLDRIIIARK